MPAKLESKRMACVKIKTLARSDSTGFIVRGSGALIAPEGLILTSYHNVKNAISTEVSLFDGRCFHARLDFFDPHTDLALLKLETTGLPCFTLKQHALVHIGETVYAIGSPASLDFTLTDGIVGGLDRQIKAIEDPAPVEHFIQTSVPINPGCSGGPLLNRHGELVGINTAIWTKSGRFEGYSFSVPMDVIGAFMDQYTRAKNAQYVQGEPAMILN